MSTRQISKPKAFQEATARAALATFHANAGPKRFLIADEVGLGKTVVARTVVAEMMRGKRTPLVVFYFASVSYTHLVPFRCAHLIVLARIAQISLVK